jgi:creatinine amidohydrolase
MVVILDYVTCLARAGFDRFFFINGHGGNISTLKAAFSETYYQLESLDREVRCQLGNWFTCRSVYRLARELYGDGEGSHATPSEVALTWYLYPDAIKKVPLSETVASGHPIYGARDFREHYPDGRMGSRSDLAAPEHGKRFFEVAVEELSGNYREFLAT